MTLPLQLPSSLRVCFPGASLGWFESSSGWPAVPIWYREPLTLPQCPPPAPSRDSRINGYFFSRTSFFAAHQKSCPFLRGSKKKKKWQAQKEGCCCCCFLGPGFANRKSIFRDMNGAGRSLKLLVIWCSFFTVKTLIKLRFYFSFFVSSLSL